jgi:bicarbonate transport system ATP-binding protein
VFQNYSLLPWLSVLDNVLFAIDSARSTFSGRLLFSAEPRSKREERARTYLDLVGLSHALDKYPTELSGGMRQRVSIARALAMEPQILLLDEPFGALDAITREEMQDELLAIWSRTKTTGLMITHDIDEAILLSDRIVLMTNGPAATIGEIFEVPFPRPRSRERLQEHPGYYTLRNAFMKALYEKFAHDDAS